MKILIRSLLYIDDNPNRDDSEIQEIPATARIYGEILLILQGIRLLWEGGMICGWMFLRNDFNEGRKKYSRSR